MERSNHFFWASNVVGTVLLIESDKGWEICSLGDPAINTVMDATLRPDEVAAKVREYADKSGAPAARVFIAIRSDHSLNATFSLRRPADENLRFGGGRNAGTRGFRPRSNGKYSSADRLTPSRTANDREMLSFRFEEELPVRAEDLVADFVIVEGEAFGVAIETLDYLPVLKELEALGISASGIAPAATLIAQELTGKLPPDTAFLQFDGVFGSELFQLERGKPTNWWFQHSHPDGAPGPFTEELRSATLSSVEPIKIATNSTLDTLQLSNQASQFELVSLDESDAHALLANAVKKITSGNKPAWINLRRGDLVLGDPLREIRWPLRSFAASLLLLLCAVGLGLLLRANQYESRMQQLHVSQMEMFANALPGQRVPEGGVVSRLKSHVKTMKGARETSQDIELSQSAILVLQQFLAAMSENKDFGVRQATIENGLIDVDLVVRSFADVNSVVSSLQNRGFAMSPPSSTQQDDQTVITRLVGEFEERPLHTKVETTTKEVSR